jgi:hypothetical protein
MTTSAIAENSLCLQIADSVFQNWSKTLRFSHSINFFHGNRKNTKRFWKFQRENLKQKKHILKIAGYAFGQKIL